MTFLPLDAQDTQPAIAFPDCTCNQGRTMPCICAETLAGRESLGAAIWRSVCRFFATPEFDAQMEAYADRTERVR